MKIDCSAILICCIAELLQSLDSDERWSNLTNDIDIVTDHWPAKAINCLTLINSRYNAVIIIHYAHMTTTGQTAVVLLLVKNI